MKAFGSALFAGFIIGLSCVSCLLVESKIAGAFLFCFGLFTICAFKLRLFTGKVGYINHGDDFAPLAIIWLGNLLGTVLCALLISAVKPEITHLSEQTVLLRLAQTTHKTAILSMLCGCLMYIAVESHRILSERSIFPFIGVLLCVPTFILCGYEHCVADMFYLSAAGHLRDSFMHLLLVTFGNAVGAILTRQIMMKLR